MSSFSTSDSLKVKISPYYDNYYSFGAMNCAPKKEKEMIDTKKPYSVGYRTFETSEEAVTYAKTLVRAQEVDVAINKIVSVVKFPIPDYEVEAVD